MQCKGKARCKYPSTRKEQAMRFETSTNIIPVINVGTYDTNLSAYNRFGTIYTDDGEEERPEKEWDDFDNSKYMAVLGEEAAKLVNPIFRGFEEQYGVTVTAPGTITSPKYYNFETDELDLDIETADDFVDKALVAIQRFKSDEKVIDFIKNNWISYDGFYSYMPSDIDGLEEKIAAMKNDEIPADRIIAGYVALCCVEGGLIPDTESDDYEFLESLDYDLSCAMDGHDFDEFVAA